MINTPQNILSAVIATSKIQSLSSKFRPGICAPLSRSALCTTPEMHYGIPYHNPLEMLASAVFQNSVMTVHPVVTVSLLHNRDCSPECPSRLIQDFTQNRLVCIGICRHSIVRRMMSFHSHFTFHSDLVIRYTVQSGHSLCHKHLIDLIKGFKCMILSILELLIHLSLRKTAVVCNNYRGIRTCRTQLPERLSKSILKSRRRDGVRIRHSVHNIDSSVDTRENIDHRSLMHGIS